MTTNYFDQWPSDVITPTTRRRGLVGQGVPGAGFLKRSGKNASGIAAHLVSLTPTSYTGSETYGFTITRDTYSYAFSHTVTAGADSVAEVIDELIAAIEAIEGGVLNIAYPTDNTTTLRLTAYVGGADAAFTLSGLTANLSQATTTTGADASAVGFGRGVIRAAAPSVGSVFSSNQISSISDGYFALPSSTTLPAITRTFVASSYTSGDLAIATGHIRYGDQIIPFAIPFGDGRTTLDTAMADLVVHLNASVAGTYLTAAYTAATDTLVVTSDFYGLYFDVDIVKTTIGATLAFAKTSANTDKVLEDLFLGVIENVATSGTTTLGTYATSIAAGQSALYIVNGGVWTDHNGTAPTAGQTVYVGTGTGEEGEFSAVAAANRIPLPRSRAFWVGSDGDVSQVMLRGS